jgi:NADPH:quinone reductase-like Zn-dependent oxidoreductase
VSPGAPALCRRTFADLFRPRLPLKLGIEGSGVVVAVGKAVTRFRPGDAVYGLDVQHPMLPIRQVGFASQYARARESSLLPKPDSLSFEDAAALGGSTLVAVQCVERGLGLMGADSLEGKTVFVTGALTGLGAPGVQVVKNYYGAEKVVATASTAKMGKVEELLPGVVDQLIDYKTQDVVAVAGKEQIDFVYNTQWDFTGTFPLIKRTTGVAVSASSIPEPDVFRSLIGPAAPRVVMWALAAAQWWYDWKLRGTGIKRAFVSGNPGDREAWEKTGEIIARGKVKAVTTLADFNDLEAVKREMLKVEAAKGTFGKLVIKIA